MCFWPVTFWVLFKGNVQLWLWFETHTHVYMCTHTHTQIAVQIIHSDGFGIICPIASLCWKPVSTSCKAERRQAVHMKKHGYAHVYVWVYLCVYDCVVNTFVVCHQHLYINDYSNGNKNNGLLNCIQFAITYFPLCMWFTTRNDNL